MAHKKMQRKEFLKISAIAGAGLLIPSCKHGSEKQETTKEQSPSDTSIVKQAAVKQYELDETIVYKKGSDKYEELRLRFNKNIDASPFMIVLCRNSIDVAAAVQYAGQHQLQVSVKSGGHSFEGFSINNDGLVLDLSAMNKVQLQEDKFAWVEPGCKLAELYESLFQKKRLIPAGSCATVGVGGLTLGGGYGLFSRKYGLTCDSLEEIIFIDGKGNIHTIQNNEPLLWACRGAGNGNFGVVTGMKFKTYQMPETLQSHRFKSYNLDAVKAKNILQNWFEQMKSLPLSCFSAFVLNGKTLTILITNSESENENLKSILNSLQQLCDKTIYGEKTITETAVKAFYGVQKPIYFKNASAGYYHAFQDIEACSEELLGKVISGGFIYQINTLGGKIMDKSFEERSAYAHRSFAFLSELQAYWDDPSKKETYMEGFQEIQNLLFQNNITSQYVNYPSLAFKDFPTAYYANNYQKLQKIKLQYDPDNIFRHAQSIAIPHT